MPRGPTNEEGYLSKARSAEERFDWIGAIENYTKAIHSSRTNEKESSYYIEERMAFCQIRAAYQSADEQQFRSGLDDVISFYAKLSADITIKANGRKNRDYLNAKSLYFQAMVALTKSWIADDQESRNNLLLDSLHLQKEAIQCFERLENNKEVVKCSEQLLLSLDELVIRESKGELLRQAINDAVNCGRRAIELISNSSPKEKSSLCRMYFLTAWFCGLGKVIVESEEDREKHSELNKEYWNKFEKLSEELHDPVLLEESLLRRGEEKEPVKLGELDKRLLPKIEETRDNLLIGALHAQMTYAFSWSPLHEENPDKLIAIRPELEKYFGEAVKRYSLVRPVGIHWEWLGYGYYSLANYWYLVARSENEPRKKEELLDKAMNFCESGHAKLGSNTTRLRRYLDFAMSLILKEKAMLREQPERKSALLDEALTRANNFATLTSELEPYRYWDCGMALTSLSNIMFERSSLEVDSKSRLNLLTTALETSRKGIASLEAGKSEQESPASAIALGIIALFLEEQDRMWESTFILSKDNSALARRLETLGRVKDSYKRADLVARVAETDWQTGIVQSTLLDHFAASGSYEKAAENFSKASEKIANLRDYYLEYSAYMRAWAQIEKARAYHNEENYEKAKLHNELAFELLEQTEKWKSIAPHHRACALVEEAENLSLADATSDIELAINKFQEAADLFRSSRPKQTERATQMHEQEESSMLPKISVLREEYCSGRIHLEGARLRYRKGERADSIKEYSSAAEILERVARDQEAEWERKEIEAIVLSCKAWEKFQEAEFKDSPKLYSEASESFIKASEAAPKERAALVAKGNSSYCKALASTLEFREGWRIDDYMIAKSHFSQAAEDYSFAGIQPAAEWFKATERLLDAFVYVNSALKETAPEKKARNFLAAEKILNIAASIYEKAGYLGKKNDALTILNKIKEESEFALSLVDIFAPSGAAPNTASFIIPTPAQDEPLGLSQFQGANVQMAASIPSEIAIGEKFHIKLDLINTGKQIAQLLKIENLLPSGLEAMGENPSLSREGRIELKGKRIKPLEIESIVIPVKAVEAKSVDYSPKVYFSDEGGTLIVNSLNPIKISVLSPQEFEFEDEKTKKVFDYLIDAFANDYMVKKFHSEKSGWRSLVEIVRDCGVPSSAIYDRRGGTGSLVSELVKRGIVEARVSSGERGRGGEVTRLRVTYEKEPVKEVVNRRIKYKK